MMSYDYPHPVSRTYQYKKITKPLLERKRRARINACLDELKDLMMDALETEGENINKLEKADILELTVRHLQRLQTSRPSGSATSTKSASSGSGDEDESRWQSGFGHCAAEACRFLSALPGEAAERLARHLAAGLQMNRRNSSTPKPNLLSPTLANLERTANLVSPSTVATGRNSPICTGSAVRRIPSYHEKIDEESNDSVATVNSPSPIAMDENTADRFNEPPARRENRETTVTSKIDGPRKLENEDDEEIDVERLDEGDPMWRPW